MSHFGISDLKVDYRTLWTLSALWCKQNPPSPRTIWAYINLSRLYQRVGMSADEQEEHNDKEECVCQNGSVEQWMNDTVSTQRGSQNGWLPLPASYGYNTWTHNAIILHGMSRSRVKFAMSVNSVSTSDQYHIQFSVFKAKQLCNIICNDMGTLGC